MPIEVVCNHCGKSLKAPESMAGKRAKCPGCSSVVTVPELEEEIFDAEVIEPEPLPAFSSGLGSLLDDELAYRVAEPEAAPTQALESRKQCPACGEMIVAHAAKCRFCNEIFDDQLRRMQSKTRGRSNLASRSSRLGAVLLDSVFAMLFLIPGFLILMAFGDRTNKEDPVLGIGILILALGGFAFAVTQLVLLSSRGQTLGKKAVSIKIVKIDDGSNPGFLGAVVLRAGVPQVIGVIPFIGAIFGIVDILFIFSEERRCLHDHIASTIVVEA